MTGAHKPYNVPVEAHIEPDMTIEHDIEHFGIYLATAIW
jgi:hypothetical protein